MLSLIEALSPTDYDHPGIIQWVHDPLKSSEAESVWQGSVTSKELPASVVSPSRKITDFLKDA